MEDAPLYKASFHQRRADRYLKHNRFDEAILCLEEALEYISKAYNDVKAPAAIKVIEVLEDEYKRHVERIKLSKIYYEGHKNAMSDQNKISIAEEAVECIGSTNLVANPNELKLVIDRTIQDFDARYSNRSTFTEHENKVETNVDHLEKETEEIKMLPTYDDLDLPPLELPNFDFSGFRKVDEQS